MRFHITLLYIFIGFALIAQHTNIKLEKPAESDYFATPCEPSVVIDPNNTNNIMVGAVMDAWFKSTDGGETWESGVLKSDLGVEGDPCLIIDIKGNYHYFHLADPPTGNRLCTMVHQKLSDFNGEWTSGQGIIKCKKKIQDKEWAVADMSRNKIYVTWTQFDAYKNGNPKYKSRILFSSSIDNGETWTKPQVINKELGDCLDDDGSMEGAVPAVGPKGEIYVAWSGKEKIYFNRSVDGGENWLNKELIVADQPGGWKFNIPGIYRCNGFPVVACDTTGGRYNGRIYLMWSDQINGKDDTDVWIITSDDEGDTWTDPKRVNTDDSKKHQFFPWMTVDQKTGKIYVVFYDRRNYEDDYTDVYIAWSEDGGVTFHDFKISDSPFLPDMNMFFGDYNAIAAYDNVVRPVWTRLDGFSISLWTSLVDVTKLGIDHSPRPKIVTGDEQVDIVNSWELPDEAYDAWDPIQDKWMKEVYWPVLTDNGIEMNCSDCEYVYLDAVFYIDDVGGMAKYVIEKEYLCGESMGEALKFQLLEYFIKYRFPAELHNRAIRVKLGTGLKC